MISALDVKSEFKRRLDAAGLWDSLDLRESQFLDLPPRVFVELVVFDAGVLGKIADVASDVRLTHPEEEIDIVVRAHWQVAEVEYAGPAIGLSGGMRGAERFDVKISSGSVTQEVSVDVTLDATSLLKSRLETTNVDPLKHRRIVADLVRGYLELHLSQGGTSYWDPVRSPHLDLNAAAAEYMIEHQLFKVGA